MPMTSANTGWRKQQAEGLAAAEETYAALVAAGRGDTRAAVDLAGAITWLATQVKENQ